MKLEIITPEQIVFSGEVNSVTLPGRNGLFTLWENHAALISSLVKGKITYITEADKVEVQINDGFVEVNNNVITVCVESV